ncbi:MAG: hypothetical protein JNL26_14220 [Gemmatimonadetes bacterium]|nr:hypothetical protein [Gemmatimonadota bacterium]
MRPFLLLALCVLARTAALAQRAPSHGSGRGPIAAVLRTDLGRHHYRVSTPSPSAQAWFDQGIRLYWAFNQADAATAFANALSEDPTCAMCAWGVALAGAPGIHSASASSPPEAARAAIAQATSLVAGATPGERALIIALGKRFVHDGRNGSDTAYANAMRDVVSAFPDDLEARVLFAEALMNLSPGTYWLADGAPRPDTPSILDALQEVLGRDADHPGACHLYIHLVEARDPARGLPCAEQLASVMPGAGHLVHMPARIYMRAGRYADALRANQQALEADDATLDRSGRRRDLYGGGYVPYTAHHLSFAAAMMGSSRLAIRYAAQAVRTIDPSVARDHDWVESILPSHLLTLVTFGRWSEVLEAPLPTTSRYATGMAYYARGVAFAARRRWAEAGAAHDSVRAIAAVTSSDDNNGKALRVAVDVLAGELAARRGQWDAAIAALRRAVAAEDALRYADPPTLHPPTRHALGKVLLLAGKPADAEAVYREDLVRHPENGWALHGLSQSLLAQGKRREGREVLARFTRAWSNADVQLRPSRF